ncbi:DUF4013 domain-containing protein [Candidatus Woesearchaeota archaeon]|jgi:hypothetical protein|nr:DUF4013 domain-containing protein [Candidatus Woesearchaeota archaeon]MBT7237364.1 DUF4013 domain-containing protein [Candidatus Woesearchaeota archaeon]
MRTLKFKHAFSYPFNRAKGLWNILWILLPIFGWLALSGYSIRIVKEFSKGKFKKLPLFKFSSDLELGFFMFFKGLPFMIAYFVIVEIFGFVFPWFGSLTDIFLGVFIVPILTVNFYNKETVSSYFEFKVLKSVFYNIGDYITVILKSILLVIVFALMIIVLIGFPAMAFTDNMFLADFYRRRVRA